MARIKPQFSMVEDREQAEGVLAEIAALDRTIQTLEQNMQEAIDAAKAQAQEQAAPLIRRRKELSEAMAVFARLNRQTLFEKGKSLDLHFGTIGFRLSTRLVQMRGVSPAATLDRLREFQFFDAIRVKEEPNKERMLNWPDERLECVGLTRQQCDTFYIEVNKDPLVH